MKSTYIIYFVLSLSILTSCDNRFDFIPNSTPKIYFGGSETQVDLTDSLKTGLNNSGGRSKGINGQEFYFLRLEGFDFEASIRNVQFRVLSGSAEIFIQDQKLEGPIPLNNGSVEIKIKPALGLNKIEFYTSDDVGETTAVFLNLFAFTNLKPVAKFKYLITKVDGNFTVQLDATGSHDLDSRFGGGITQYEYQINEILPTIKTDNVIIPVNFPGPGGYTIRYRVFDNEGEPSEWQRTEPFTLTQ
jgi:hypothetical protein